MVSFGKLFDCTLLTVPVGVCLYFHISSDRRYDVVSFGELFDWLEGVFVEGLFPPEKCAPYSSVV